MSQDDMSQEFHLSDQELLMAVDGELSDHAAERVQSHLAACWACRARKQEIETTIGEFMRFQRESFNHRFPSPEGPRALLRAQMAQLASVQANPWAAIVVDDLASTNPWSPRMLEIRGRAEAVADGGANLGPGFGDGFIRIYPEKVNSFGIE